MSKKEIIFQNYLYNSKQYKINIKKTKKILSALIIDLKRSEIPLLDSYKENCHFDFTNQLINKYSKYKNIIIFGMGGSILGAKSIFSFFKKKIKKKVFFFDNLDLNLFKEYQEVKNLKNSCFIVVSKSGETLETITNLGATFSKKLFKGKMVFITEIKDNVLLELADRYKADLIEHKEFISGRYSVLSESAMFPAALMGVKYKKFHNLTKLINNKNFIKSLIQNVATIYTLNSRGINNSVILNYDFSLNDLGYWYQQLVAESLGKKRKGINPTLSFGPKDHHSLLQLYLDGPKDKFFTFFNFLKYEKKIKISSDVITSETRHLKNKDVKLIINSQCNAVKNIFKLKKIPFREINFYKKDEKELGKIFTFLVLETILLARLMKINPFNQPAVEEVKIETKKILI